MSIRDTEEYKTMTPYMATGYAEGFGNGTPEQELAAWQFIADTGIWRQLQGFFGRTVHHLIDSGEIEMPTRTGLSSK